MTAATLFIVATPIGQYDDLSPRAVRVLSEADHVLAEDTRRTGQLLAQVGVKASLVAVHEHNEQQRVQQVLAWLQQGKSLALVSDAGTPLISDPGFVLVRAVRAAGFSVSAIPGPCALIAALSISGLPTDRFLFEGFLPVKSAARVQRLQAVSKESATLVYYESRHRILDTLASMIEVMGADRQMILARELTKTYEQILQGSLAEVSQQLQQNAEWKRGEMVLVLEGHRQTEEQSLSAEQQLWVKALAQALPPSQAAQIMAQVMGGKKRSWYQMLEEMR